MTTRRVVRERIDPRLTGALFASYRTPVDALITGVAWSPGAAVVTRNPDDFLRMGVPVLAYEADTA